MLLGANQFIFLLDLLFLTLFIFRYTLQCMDSINGDLSSSQTTTVHFWHYYISIITMEARLVKLRNKTIKHPTHPGKSYKSPLY